MPVRQTLRALVSARLTAAAEDIFELFESTIREYEDELCQKSLRGLEDRVKAVEQELSRALLSQNTTLSHSPQRRASSSATVEERTPASAVGTSATVEERTNFSATGTSVTLVERTPVSAIGNSVTLVERTPVSAIGNSVTLVERAPVSVVGNSVTLVERTPVSAIGSSVTLVERTPVSAIGNSVTLEECTVVSAVKTGADGYQPVWHQVFTKVEELLTCTRTVCLFCAKQKLGNEAHLLHKHLKEAMYFVSNNTEQFVIACFCQEKPLDHNRSHYHCPLCDFRAFSRDATFKKHLSGLHGITANKKSAVPMPLLCPALSLNQEIQEKIPEEQSRVKQEEEQLPVPVPESSAVCVKREESSLLTQRQTETQDREDVSSETHLRSDTEDTDDDDNWTRPVGSSVRKSTGLFPKITSAAETSASVDKVETAGAERRKHQCPFCRKRFGFKQVLQSHVRVHLGEKPSVFDKTFVERSQLSRHMKSHTGERSYSCSVCSKTCSRNSHLIVHMRTHTGEKPYSCSVCDKSFSQKSNLTGHMKTHRRERRFSCSVCRKTFALRTHRNAHMTTHSRKNL